MKNGVWFGVVVLWSICWHFVLLRLPTSLKSKWQGSAAIHNLFKEDIDFLYFRIPEDENQSQEIKQIGLPITEPIEHNCTWNRESQKKTRTKRSHSPVVFSAKLSLFTFKFTIVKLHNYFRTLSVLFLPNFDRFHVKSEELYIRMWRDECAQKPL